MVSLGEEGCACAGLKVNQLIKNRCSAWEDLRQVEGISQYLALAAPVPYTGNAACLPQGPTYLGRYFQASSTKSLS